jgi:hypothetical protein
MTDILPHPLPWYIAGPLIGLMVPALLLLGNKPFGISSNFRHVCAAVAPCGLDFFSYDWKRVGVWNLMFCLASLPERSLPGASRRRTS